MPIGDHHREQSRQNRCVPACTCIVLSWLGHPSDEDAVCDGWLGSARGYALEDAARAVGGAHMSLDPDQPSSYDWLRIQLREPRWLIAQVFSAPMMRFNAALRPPPASRFGPLTNMPFGALHAVVLVGVEEKGFRYLDPYYPAARQPFVLSNEQFAEAWQGEIVLAPAPAPAYG